MENVLDRFSQNSVGKVAHGPRKKSLGFGDNPDHVNFGFGLGLRLDGREVIPVSL